MPKRNLVWLLVVVAVGTGLWVWPHTIVRRDLFYNTFGTLYDVQMEIHRKYVEEVQDSKLLRGAIRGMLRELDPYSDYFDAEEYPQFHKRTTGQFYGIGVEVAIVSGALTIISPIEDTPAFKAGLRTGDRILQIDGESTRDMTLSHAVNRIGGEAGTEVRLKIVAMGEIEPRDVVIKRGLVTLQSVKGYRQAETEPSKDFIDRDAGIGYVRLTAFEENTAQQLDVAVGRMTQAGLKALVIDVRDNPGGLLKSAVEVVDRFLSEGRIVSTKGRTSTEEVWPATSGFDYPNRVPLVILVNDGSASASEILSGALRDHKRATLVGERTFGKGSVQTLVEMDKGASALKLTTSYYYLPSGERIHGHGVAPDVEVKLTREEKEALMSLPLIVTTTQGATQTAPASRPAIRDRQLEKAVEILRAKLGLASRPTTQPTPVSVPAAGK